MMTHLGLFLLVALILGTASTGIDMGALLKACRNGQDRWIAEEVTGPDICKLVTRMFVGRIWKKGGEYGGTEGKDWNKRIGNWVVWYLDRRQNLDRHQRKEKDYD